MLEIAFQPDRESREPVYRQLEWYLRELVASGRLAAGEKLPASRELSVSLGLSRNTVNQAYQALVEDGLLTSHVGQGTFVAAREPGSSEPQSEARVTAAPAREGGARHGFAWTGLFARRTRYVTLPPAFQDPHAFEPSRFDFRGGQVDSGTLPTAELKRAFSHVTGELLPELASYKDPRGWLPLRQEIARSLVARGITCDADDVAVMNGAQQALDVIARVLVDPGDTVVMEQPGYFGASLAFAACGSHLVGVGVDQDGLRTDELARILRARRAKLVYATPAVQSPTGVVMSDKRRQALLELADAYQVPVVEDDYDCELRYGSPPTPALKTLDRAGQVIYVGTFSKALFAGLRVGYVVAPPPLLWRMVLSRWAADFFTDLVTQASLAELLASGGLERHVRRVRRVYAARRAVLLEALTEFMPEGTRWIEPSGGNAVWVLLPPGVDGVEVYRRARAAGIDYTRGDLFYLEGGGGTDQLSLSFAQLSRADIQEGVSQLANIVRDVRRDSRSAA